MAENKQQEPPQHRCYRNWSGSSAAMESEILVEGFRLSEQAHGIRYMHVIGDGDSSLMANLQQSVAYGPFITKIECANHVCKSYRSRLEKLAKDHPEFRGRGGLTQRIMQRLTVGARLAIKMHSKTGNVTQLRHDLRNGPNHVFGDHSQCNPAFCKVATKENDDASNSDGSSDSDSDMHDDSVDADRTLTQQLDDIIESELDDQPTATDEHDACRGGSTVLSNLPVGLLEKVKACGDRLVMLSRQVIDNKTSNLAECYMSIRSVFDGGKQFNRIQSGAFEGRCYAAGLRVQVGPTWQLQTLEHATGVSSGKVLEAAVKRKVTQLEKDRNRKATDQYKVQRKSSKYIKTPSLQHDYGPDSQQPDVTPDELDRLCSEFFERDVRVTVDQARNIEGATKQQSDTPEWYHQ